MDAERGTTVPKSFVNQLSAKKTRPAAENGSNKTNCSKCNKLLAVASLPTHMAIIHNIGSAFNCAECNQRFAKRNRLLQHMEKHRIDMESRKQITCELCNYKTTKSNYLKDHRRNVHLRAPETYRCLENGCMKIFETRYLFKKHLELHKQLACDLCNVMFTAARSLKRHKRKQHMLSTGKMLTTLNK